MDQQETKASIDGDIMLSDGSNGTAMGLAAEYAKLSGHNVCRLTYPGSGASGNGNTLFEISSEHLRESNRHLMRATKSMHKSWPRQQVTQDNSLRRDLWLVRYTHRIYIVGLFTQDASLLKINGDVAWPAQMYVDRFLFDQEPLELCEIFMFDIKSEAWWQWNKNWTMVSKVPSAHGVYTVLGSEKMTNASKDAVKGLFAGVNL